MGKKEAREFECSLKLQLYFRKHILKMEIKRNFGNYKKNYKLKITKIPPRNS